LIGFMIAGSLKRPPTTRKQEHDRAFRRLY
jgi:hypothetical protein